MSFITLAQFMNLADPLDTKFFRSAWRINPRPEYWTKYYEVARESFETYGEAGPPFGSKVICLQPGHGGSSGVIRVFDGLYPSDERFFQVYYSDTSRNKNGEKAISLVTRSIWWSFIAVVDERVLGNYREHKSKWGFLTDY